MRKPNTKIYIHLTWTTWERKPALTHNIAGPIHDCLQQQCAQLGVELLQIGGTPDHVHILVRIPSVVSVADLANQAKAATANLVNYELGQAGAFRWQAAYSAFSLAEEDVQDVQEYIANQVDLHATGAVDSALEPEETLHPQSLS